MHHRLMRAIVCAAIAFAGCDSLSGSSLQKRAELEEKRANTKAQLAQKMSGAQAGEEREVDPGVFMTIYRSAATQPLPDGWQLATSTKGGFSVELPLPFNDLRVRAQTEDHVELRTDMVGAKSPGLLSWMATCVTRADGKSGRPGVPPPTNVTEPKGDPVRAWQRTIVDDHHVCMLIVEAQGTDPLPAQAQIQRFLKSFKLS